MLHDVTIRPVESQEIQELQKMGWETFHHAFGPLNTKENIEEYLAESFSLEKIRNEFASDNSFFYFAVLDNVPIGYLKLNRKESQTDYKDGNGLEVERIYVVEGYQGNKVGQQLIEFSLSRAREEKVEYLWLGVWEKNEAAIRFYERMGFWSFDSHSFVLGTEQQTDIVMKIELL